MKFLRSLSLMLAIAFFMGAVVPQGAQASESIGSAFERYHYAMNVEWDQQDLQFMQNAEKELSDSLKYTDAKTLEAFTANSFADAKTRDDFLNLIAAMKAQNLSKEEAMKVAASWAQSLHKGLSFNGDGPHFPRGGNGHLLTIVTVVVVVVVICHVFSHHGGHDRD